MNTPWYFLDFAYDNTKCSIDRISFQSVETGTKGEHIHNMELSYVSTPSVFNKFDMFIAVVIVSGQLPSGHLF